MSEPVSPSATAPASRFSRVFKWLMLFCFLVWVWGLALIMAWPWQKGGEWLPEFPMVTTCTSGEACVIPNGELAKAMADGRIKAVTPPTAQGETAFGQISLGWKPHDGLIEASASSWNFQFTVRYRVENDQPVLVQYREISIKIFFYALGGALFSLIGLYLRQLRH